MAQIDNHDTGIPLDAQAFKARSEGEINESGPTKTQLAFFRTMTGEEWEARNAGHQEFMAAMDRQDEQDQQQWEEKQREKWNRKIQALESVRPTGIIMDDARAFFEAAAIDPNTLDSPYAQAFQDGNDKLMLEYFTGLRKATVAAPSGVSAGAQEYFRKLDGLVKLIIDAAETAAK